MLPLPGGIISDRPEALKLLITALEGCFVPENTGAMATRIGPEPWIGWSPINFLGLLVKGEVSPVLWNLETKRNH